MGNIKWYVGQPIVCIQSHSRGIIKKGQEFVIKGIKQTCCSIQINVGKQAKCDTDECSSCNKITRNMDNIWWLKETLFAPLDVDISELTEMLTKEFQNK